MSKKIFSKLEMVSFGRIKTVGAVTLLMVSKMDVREGKMELPEIVWSQYLRF